MLLVSNKPLKVKSTQIILSLINNIATHDNSENDEPMNYDLLNKQPEMGASRTGGSDERAMKRIINDKNLVEAVQAYESELDG